MKPTIRILASALLAAVSVPCVAFAQYRYPDTRRSDQTDVYHGVRVADPYRWLENTDSPETKTWIEAQNAVTGAYLASIPQREAIRRRLTELWNYPKYGLPVKKGNRYFFTENSGLQNQSVLYVQEGLRGRQRILLDPNTLSADGTVSLVDWSPSPNGRTLAYALSSGGSDWREFRVRDIATGKDAADTLKWIKFSGISWTRDNRGFLYSRYEPDTGNALTRVVRGHRVFHHRLGTPQSADRLIFEKPDETDWIVDAEVSHDGQYLILSIYEGTDTRNRLYFFDLDNPTRPNLGAPVVRLLDKFDAAYTFVGNVGSAFLIQTNKDSPRGRIVAIDINNTREQAWRAVVAQSDDAIEWAKVVGDRLVVNHLDDAHSTIRLYALPGTSALSRAPVGPPRGRGADTADLGRRRPSYAYMQVGEVELPGLGTVSSATGEPDNPEMFYSFTSFLYPTTIFRHDVRRGRGETFKAPRVAFDPARYETKQLFFTSKDGTRVPMFVTARKGIPLDGSNPVLMHAYGGFNIAQTPSFSIRNLVWMEMGGVSALANIRGGSEYGKEWHDAGKLDNKQNVFDDFIAAAEYLVREKYTSPGKLAISGGSNGGLLVGAVVNQRPDLFGAALPAVGVMDMLRFHKFTIGWAWTSDYGSADNPDQFRVLFAYSPLHNIKPRTRYPATMILTADHDDRVVPGHSFKYAAALQAAQVGPAPVLIRIETRAGHSAGTPTSKQIEESADRLSFLVRELGVSLPR